MDYTIRVSTPADLSGLERATQALANMEKRVEELHAKATSQSLDDELAKAFEELHASPGYAMDQTREKVEELKKEYEELQKTKEEGEGEEEDALGLGEIAAAGGAALAVMEALKAGFEEFNEAQAASVKLAGFGIGAEEADAHAELLERLELFTDGDAIKAAELYGQVMNGVTRVFKQYGIEVEANASKEERLAALWQLGARGAEKQATANQTLMGSTALLGKGLAQAVGGLIGWADSLLGVTAFVGDLNEALGFAAEKTEAAAKATDELNEALEETPEDAEMAAAAAEKVAESFGDIADRAAAATTKIDLMQRMLSKAGKTDDLEALEIDKREANGEDPIAIARARANLADKRALEERERDRQNIARTRGEIEDARKELDAVEKSQRGGPAERRIAELTAKQRLDSPAKDAAMKEYHEALEKVQSLEKKKKELEAIPGFRARTALNEVDSEMGWARIKAADAKREAEGSNLNKREQGELATLLKQRGAEQAAIATQRGKLLQTEQQAAKVEADLVDRQKAAKLKREISEATIAKKEEDDYLRKIREKEAGEETLRKGFVERNREEREDQKDKAKMGSDPIRELENFGRDVVARGASPERREELAWQLDKLKDGATEEEVDAFGKTARKTLEHRARNVSGKRGEAAREDLGELKKLEDAAKKAAAEAAQFAPAVKTAMDGVTSGIQEATKALKNATAAIAANKRLVQGTN